MSIETMGYEPDKLDQVSEETDEQVPRQIVKSVRDIFESRVIDARQEEMDKSGETYIALGQFTSQRWEDDLEFRESIEHLLSEYGQQARQDALRDAGFPDPMYFAQQI